MVARTGRVLLVSNRGPFELRRDEQSGTVAAIPASGGVATALRLARGFTAATWLASPLTVEDETAAANCTALSGCRFVRSSEDNYRLFYNGFSNRLLWPLQHGLSWSHADAPELESWLNGYCEVNADFAQAVVEETDRSEYEAVMFQDYHLYLAPRLVRNQRPNLYLQHFVHIPWPAPESWQKLDVNILASICHGLLANDSIVFQTAESAHNFLMTVAGCLPEAGVDLDHGVVSLGGRKARIWWDPISVDPCELEQLSATPEFRQYQAALRARPAEKLIVRVDRLDPAKNVPAGFQAFWRLLDAHRELRGKVSFLAMLVPSRQEIPEYAELEKETLDLVRELNSRFGDANWQPVRVYYENNRLQALAAMSLADVLLVNSLADGMNLVAKEGVLVSERDSLLILSNRAGAYAELATGALGIDPADIPSLTATLNRALSLDETERRRRAKVMRQAVQDHDLRNWFSALLDDITESQNRRAAYTIPAERPAGNAGPLETLAAPGN